MTNQSTPQRSCLYARVSSELQEERGTINSQLDELRRSIAAANDLLTSEYVDDGYSGELLERPALDRLRTEAVKELWTKVYILSPDRLARKPHVAGLVIDELQGHGIEVIFLNRPLGNTVEDQLLFGIQSLFADYEKEKYKERQRRGKLFKARKGSIVGGKAPYGYRYIRDAATGIGRYEVDENEAAVVRLIYEWYTGGKFPSFRTIVRELHTRGIRSRMGKATWSQASVGHILSDSTYTGTTYYNKRRRVPPRTKPTEYRRSKNTSRTMRDKSEWVPVSVPAIVSPDQYERAQRVKQKNCRLATRHAKHDYLLKNLATCGECSSAMYARYTVRQSRTRYFFYECSLRMKRFPLPTSHRLMINSKATDEAVWGAIVSVLSSPEVLREKVNQVIRGSLRQSEQILRERERIEARLATLNEKRRRMIEAYQESVITSEEFKDSTAAFGNEVAELTAKKDALASETTQENRPLTEEEAQVIVREYKSQLPNASFRVRRNVIQALVQRTVVTSKRRLELECQLPALSSDKSIATEPLKWSGRNCRRTFKLCVSLRERQPSRIACSA